MHLFCTSLVLCVLSACRMITSTCDELLTSGDADFCKGELKLIYPDLVIDKCWIIPQRTREKISKEWGSPQVQLPCADEEKKYTLLMVDPDAPSRQKPSRAYWRHWLLVDIKGEAFKTGDVRGIELSAYTRPTPPQGTGLHRYQFLVFEQPEDQTLSLSSQEKSSLGCWSGSCRSVCCYRVDSWCYSEAEAHFTVMIKSNERLCCYFSRKLGSTGICSEVWSGWPSGFTSVPHPKPQGLND